MPCPDGEELGDHLERHPLGLGDLEEHEDPRDHADGCVDPEDAGEADGGEQDGERVGHSDVTDPVHEGADRDAEPPDARGEDLGAEDVGYGAVGHHEAAEVDHHADGAYHRVHHRAYRHELEDDQDHEGQDEDRDRGEQQSPGTNGTVRLS